MKKIEMVCDMHRIPFGSPRNLAGFVCALDDNKHLAMDFWSLVARVSDMEEPVGSMHTRVTATDKARNRLVLNGRLLETIVQGVAGRSVAEAVSAGGHAPQGVMDLASLLAGADIFAPADIPCLASPTEVVPADTLPVAPLLPFVDTKRTVNADPVAEVPPVSDPPFETPKVMAQPVAPFPFRRDDGTKRSVVRTELPFAGKLLRATASSEALHLAAIGQTQESEVQPLSVRTRTDEGSSEKRVSLKFALSLLAAIVASGVGLLTAQHYGMISWRSMSGRQVLRSGRGQLAMGNAVSDPMTPTTVAVPAIPHIGDQKRSASEQSRDSRPESGGAVSVPHSVMQANLISSRMPIYPETARQNGIKGRVVLQVIVSKDGRVGHARVVAGNPALSEAAIQAVAKWRYRPYVVNGEPVNVSTLVTVDLPSVQGRGFGIRDMRADRTGI